MSGEDCHIVRQFQQPRHRRDRLLLARARDVNPAVPIREERIATEQHLVRLAVERDLARAVAGCVHDAERTRSERHLVALIDQPVSLRRHDLDRALRALQPWPVKVVDDDWNAPALGHRRRVTDVVPVGMGQHESHRRRIMLGQASLNRIDRVGRRINNERLASLRVNDHERVRLDRTRRNLHYDQLVLATHTASPLSRHAVLRIER
jgi:hypothetical protein